MDLRRLRMSLPALALGLALQGRGAAPLPPGAAYLGQRLPGERPERFAPALLAPFKFLGRIAFSPDGQTCAFTVGDATYTSSTLYLTHFQDGAWTAPQAAPFVAGFEKSGEPFFSADGTQLTFSARIKGGTTGMDFWVVAPSGQGWSAPTRLPAPLNSDANDFCFSRVADGTVYFLSKRSGAPQVHRARPAGDTWTVELIPAPILSVGTFEGDPCVAPDGRFLVFYSGRPGGHGRVDLQLAFADGRGGWTPPVNLGPDFNTEADEYGATLTPDGKAMFFVRHSLEGGELHWVATSALDRRRPVRP